MGQGKEESWHIDLKETGTVGKGLAPKGKKPGVTLVLSDVEFAKLISDKANAQNMFMQGKLKIKGNMMAATKLGPILEKAQSKAKLQAQRELGIPNWFDRLVYDN